MSRGSLSLISSYVMLLSKCGHLLAERPLACASAHVLFFSLFWFFSFSPSLWNVNWMQPSEVFRIPPGATEVICQPVTQSVGNVCFHALGWMRRALLQRLLSNTVPERQCWMWSRSQHWVTALLHTFSYDDDVIVDQEVHLHFKQHLNPIHIFKRALPLIPPLSPSAISHWQQSQV